MDDGTQLTEFGKVFIYLLTGTFMVLFTLFLGKTISPKKPYKLKMSTYECGEEAKGSAWIQFNPRFYVIALVFLLFDVELIFIFPWATVFGQESLINADQRWGWFTLIEMFLFVGILVIGLIYVWVNGDLEWVRPRPVVERLKNRLPEAAYQQLNQAVYEVHPLTIESTLASKQAQAKLDSPSKGFKPKLGTKKVN